MTKTEMRSWMKRVREDLREAEKVLRLHVHADDDAVAAELYDLFSDAAGACAELQNATAATDPYHQYEDEEDYADDCTSDENCDHPTHYRGCPEEAK